MIWLKLTVIGLIMIAPIYADACPAIEPDMETRNQLHDNLRDAQTEAEGRLIGGELWRIWTTAPDERAQSLLDLGREQIRYGEYAQAEAVLSELIEYCPDYAEGWNQRAFAKFLRQDYENALQDISKALELEPRHFGALSGRAVTLINMGRIDIGHKALREALKLNPWLSERHMLPQGQDI